MYKQYFGLRKPLFDSGIAQDAAVFLEEAQLRAMDRVAIALTSHDSAILLCGPPGIGKTTFAAAAIRTSSSSTRMASTWLSNPPLSANELLELLLAEFGFDPYKHSRVERLQIWRQFLTELGATDTRIFIGLEQTESVPPAVLHALASLTVADPNGCPGANLVLMGQEGLIDLLNAPPLKELKQRVRLINRFEALSDEDVEAYLRHCVEMAGGAYESVFAAESSSALRAYSGGIPRILNNLCDTALALAAAGGTSNVTVALVTRAAVEFCGMPPLTVDEIRPEPVTLPDEIPLLTESVEIDLGSGEYEAVTQPDLIDAGTDSGAPYCDAEGAPDFETERAPDIEAEGAACFGAEAATVSGSEPEPFGPARSAPEPHGDVLPSGTPALLGLDLDDLTAELAEAILSADLPDDLDYPDFPQLAAAPKGDAAMTDEGDEAAMNTVDSFRARA